MYSYVISLLLHNNRDPDRYPNSNCKVCDTSACARSLLRSQRRPRAAPTSSRTQQQIVIQETPNLMPRVTKHFMVHKALATTCLQSPTTTKYSGLQTRRMSSPIARGPAICTTTTSHVVAETRYIKTTPSACPKAAILLKI